MTPKFAGIGNRLKKWLRETWLDDSMIMNAFLFVGLGHIGNGLDQPNVDTAPTLLVEPPVLPGNEGDFDANGLRVHLIQAERR